MYVVFLVVAILYAGACTVAGFVRPTDRLQTFQPAIGSITRTFRQDVEAVRSAYQQAIGRTPGMRLHEGSADSLLIDLRPTSRIMSENFGMVIRLRLAPENSSGTRVVIDARRKVRFAFGMNTGGALQHAERQLRMNAKTFGIEEFL